MKYILISSNSRNSVLTFSKILSNYSIQSKIVSTPRAVSVSCGLCVKTDYRFLKDVINIIHQSKLNGFDGVFLYTRINTTERIERIY